MSDTPHTMNPPNRPDAYTLRAADERDLPLLPEIERAAATRFAQSRYPGLVEIPPMSAHTDLRLHRVWVVVGEDRPVGFLVAGRLAGGAHIYEVDVHPAHARRGLGRRLIDTLAEWARGEVLTALTLTTFSDVPWNGPYYERLGFRRLESPEVGDELRDLLRREAVAGLPMKRRICMQRELGGHV
jgi:GNAT superfamily N-acetyltransferase